MNSQHSCWRLIKSSFPSCYSLHQQSICPPSCSDIMWPMTVGQFIETCRHAKTPEKSKQIEIGFTAWGPFFWMSIFLRISILNLFLSLFHDKRHWAGVLQNTEQTKALPPGGRFSDPSAQALSRWNIPIFCSKIALYLQPSPSMIKHIFWKAESGAHCSNT